MTSKSKKTPIRIESSKKKTTSQKQSINIGINIFKDELKKTRRRRKPVKKQPPPPPQQPTFKPQVYTSMLPFRGSYTFGPVSSAVYDRVIPSSMATAPPATALPPAPPIVAPVVPPSGLAVGASKVEPPSTGVKGSFIPKSEPLGSSIKSDGEPSKRRRGAISGPLTPEQDDMIQLEFYKRYGNSPDVKTREVALHQIRGYVERAREAGRPISPNLQAIYDEITPSRILNPPPEQVRRATSLNPTIQQRQLYRQALEEEQARQLQESIQQQNTPIDRAESIPQFIQDENISMPSEEEESKEEMMQPEPRLTGRVGQRAQQLSPIIRRLTPTRARPIQSVRASPQQAVFSSSMTRVSRPPSPFGFGSSTPRDTMAGMRNTREFPGAGLTSPFRSKYSGDVSRQLR